MYTDARTPARTPAPLPAHIDRMVNGPATPAESEITVHEVYVHDSKSFCRVQLWAHADDYARRVAVETAAKHRGLELYDTVHATVTERDVPVMSQDEPYITERGHR